MRRVVTLWFPDVWINSYVTLQYQKQSKNHKTDMKLFDIFKRTQPQSEAHLIEQGSSVITDSPTSPSTNDNGNEELITIQYGTGMPIDVIYGFINHDYEQDGYQDALVNSDAEYCLAKEKIILNQLNQLFRRILLRYRGEIRDIEVQIANAKSLFALTSASMLDARKETCEEHINEINEMIEKVNAKSSDMMTMIESYRRGFTKGCAAQTANFLNPNRITA